MIFQNVKSGLKKANQKYGKGWRERGLVSNSDNQWSDADLHKFI